jgi:sec-independent protein translocase protein TatA
MIAEIFSPEILIVLLVVLVLFGGSRIPQMARSLGSAKREFEKGAQGDEPKTDQKSKSAE